MLYIEDNKVLCIRQSGDLLEVGKYYKLIGDREISTMDSNRYVVLIEFDGFGTLWIHEDYFKIIEIIPEVSI